jgi:hypothetical protein
MCITRQFLAKLSAVLALSQGINGSSPGPEESFESLTSTVSPMPTTIPCPVVGDVTRSSERIAELLQESDFVGLDFSFDSFAKKPGGAIAGWKPGKKHFK